MLEGIPIPPIDRKFYADQENHPSSTAKRSQQPLFSSGKGGRRRGVEFRGLEFSYCLAQKGTEDIQLRGLKDTTHGTDTLKFPSKKSDVHPKLHEFSEISEKKTNFAAFFRR